MTHSDELVDFANKAILADLRVVQMDATSPNAGAPDNFEVKLDATSRVRDDLDELRVDYRIRGFVDVMDESKKLLLKMSSTWGASFTFAEPPISTSDEVRNEFQAAVIIMSVYPYIRELAQSTCSRFGLPGVVIPMLKAGDLQGANLAPSDPAGSDA